MTTVACPACGVALDVKVQVVAVAGAEVRTELVLTWNARAHLRTCGGPDEEDT